MKPARIPFLSLVLTALAVAGWTLVAWAQARSFTVDLTHPIPTFQQGDVGQADLTKPIGKSRPIASFSSQAVLVGLPNFPTGDGHFALGRIISAPRTSSSPSLARASKDRTSTASTSRASPRRQWIG